MAIPITIGGRIREWREKRGMTVSELARLSTLASSTLYDLERGSSKTTTKLHLIAAALRVNVHYLETGKGSAEDLTVRETALHYTVGWPFTFPSHRFEALSPGQKRSIEAVVEELVTKFEGGRPHRHKKSSNGS